MGMIVGGKRGIVSEMNVVPLIDILLVLLVIFMIIPVHSKGLDALIPQQSTQPPEEVPNDLVVVVQVHADGTLRINREPVPWDSLSTRLEEVFTARVAHRFYPRRWPGRIWCGGQSDRRHAHLGDCVSRPADAGFG